MIRPSRKTTTRLSRCPPARRSRCCRSTISLAPEQDYFVDGITEEIIAELTRFPELFVLARNTTFQFKGQAIDVRAVGKELGVQYVVEGSVRTDRETIRVTAQMIDAGSGGHVWAETYERDLSAQSIFAVQDDITQRIVGALAGKHGLIARIGEQRVHATRTENLAAHDCFLRAKPGTSVSPWPLTRV